MAAFETVAARFWHPEITRAALPPLTPQRVTAAERLLGVTLPAELLTLLRVRNGGVVAEEWDACPAEPNSWAPDHVPFEHIHGAGPAGEDGLLTLGDNAYLVDEWDLPTGVVLLSGDGHSWVALDYRAPGEPSVTWLDADRGTDLALAPTFRAFVESLTTSEDFPDDD